MKNDDVNKYINHIHEYINGRPKFQIAMTGGGTKFVSTLMSLNDTSKIVESIDIPRSVELHHNELNDIFNTNVNIQYYSKQNSFALAYKLSKKAGTQNNYFFGISASLNNEIYDSKQQKTTENGAYLCALTKNKYFEKYIVFDNKISKEKQEDKLTLEILKFIANVYSGIPPTAELYSLQFSLLDIIDTINNVNFAIYPTEFNPFDNKNKMIFEYKDDIEFTILEKSYPSLEQLADKINESLQNKTVLFTNKMSICEKIDLINTWKILSSNKFYYKISLEDLRSIETTKLKELYKLSNFQLDIFYDGLSINSIKLNYISISDLNTKNKKEILNNEE